MTSHLARLRLAGAGFPTWPAALEVLERHGGERIVVAGEAVCFDLSGLEGCDLSPELCPVGRIGERWIGVDVDGRVFVGDEVFEDLDAWRATW